MEETEREREREREGCYLWALDSEGERGVQSLPHFKKEKTMKTFENAFSFLDFIFIFR